MARDFDGVDDVIDVGSGAHLDDLAAWTHCCWFYARTTGEAGFGRLYQKSPSGPGKVMHVQATGAVRAACSRATTNQELVSANNTFPLLQWNFAAYTYDGTTGRLYVGTPGGTVSEVTYATNTQGAGALSTEATATLQWGNQAGTTTFDGRLARGKWFSAALSLAELQLCLLGYPVRRDVCVGDWEFFGEQSPEPDTSGYNSHGTVTGAIRGDHPPGIALWGAARVTKAAAGSPTLISASDTLAPGITDAVSTLAASLAVSDTLAPAITDAVATLAATLAVSDTIAPGVSDAAAVLAALSASDTLAPGVTDTAAIAVVIAASDTLAPGITDAVSDFAALLAVADTLGTGITDTTAQIFATLAAADALDVRIVDAAALLAALSASDTLAPGIADTAAVLVQLSAGDTVAVSISDGALVDILASTLGHMVAIITVRPALAGGVSADAALGAAPRVAPAIGGKPTLH